MSNTISNKNKPITTSEIARLCGVSRTTVSAVLNGKRNVRESTRKAVLECIRRKDYKSGVIAKTLVQELSRMIAVLTPDIANHYHMMVFQGINEVLEAEGYHTLFHNMRLEDEKDGKTLAGVWAYRPAGYIILRGAEGTDGEHARRILEDGIPLVSEGKIAGIETNSVTFENRGPMKLATDYVIERGHRRLSHLAAHASSNRDAKERQLGFVESLLEHDIPITEGVIVRAGDYPVAGYQAAMEALKNPDSRPTALLCFNDMVALGAYRAANELALEIPRDLSVVGFDGMDFAELMGPPLTGVDVAPKGLGREAALLLLRVIRNEVGPGVTEVSIEPKLIERASVRRL